MTERIFKMQRHGVLHRKRRHVLLFIFVCICAVALLWNRGEVAPTMLHKIEQPDVFNTHSVVEAVAAEDHAKVLQRHRKLSFIKFEFSFATCSQSRTHAQLDAALAPRVLRAHPAAAWLGCGGTAL